MQIGAAPLYLIIFAVFSHILPSSKKKNCGPTDKYFDNRFNITVVFQAILSNICWFQLLKCNQLSLHVTLNSGTHIKTADSRFSALNLDRALDTLEEPQ